MQIKSALLAFVVMLSTSSAYAINSQGLQDTMGALSKYLADNTKAATVNEKEDALTPSAEQKYRDLQTDLEPCTQTKINEPEIVVIGKDGVTAKFKKFNLQISGDKCPMELEAKIESSLETDDHIEAKFILAMKFKDAGLIQKYQMKSVSVSGDISSRAVKTGNVINLPTKLTITASGEDSNGKQLAQQIMLGVDVNVDMASFNFGMKIEQSGFITLDKTTDTFYGMTKMQGFGQFEVLYKINNKEVSNSEFQKFMQAFIVVGNVEEKDPNAPDSRTTSMCSHAVFDKKAITSEQLKNQLTSGSLQTAGLLNKGQVCMTDATTNFTHLNKNYANNISFGQDWISFSSDARSAGSNAAIYILYKDTAAQTHESDDFIFGMQCTPVSVCR